MKANRIPQRKRIENHIGVLSDREDAYREPIGGGNPYWRCKGCGISDPYLSIEGGHRKHCPVKGLAKEIAYYKSLLESVP